MNKPRVPSIITMPTSAMREASERESMRSFLGRGFWFMVSSSTGSRLSARAGRPSVTRFIQRICTASSGSAFPKTPERMIAKKMVNTSPRFELRR